MIYIINIVYLYLKISILTCYIHIILFLNISFINSYFNLIIIDNLSFNLLEILDYMLYFIYLRLDLFI